MTLIVVYWTWSVVTIIAGPTLGWRSNPFQNAITFHLYAFPKDFRVAQLTLLLSAAFGYAVMMGVVKQVMKRRQQQQICPT